MNIFVATGNQLVQVLQTSTDWRGIARHVRRVDPKAYLEAENGDTCRDVRKMRGWARKRAALDLRKETERRAEVKALALMLAKARVRQYTPSLEEVNKMVRLRLVSSYKAAVMGLYRVAQGQGPVEITADPLQGVYELVSEEVV